MGRLFGLAIGLIAAAVSAAEVDVYLFWRVGCPHCEREIAYLERLAAADPSVRVHKFEVTGNRESLRLLVRAAEALAVDSGSVPLTVIGDRVWIGYWDDASTGRELRGRIEQCLRERCPDTVGALRTGAAAPASGPAPHNAQWPETVRIPLLGEVRTATLSLPALTVALGMVDGFNPCAMWVLVFLLGLLAGMKDRRRMWILGGVFVAASALTYLLVLGAWLNVLLLAGAIVWVRIGVGAIALATGGLYLRSFLRSAQPACEITAPQRRRHVFARLKALALEQNFLLAAGGIVLLAIAVNLVEFLCSAGIPAVFTQVLALSSLSAWAYTGYLLLYVCVFMLDDLIVLALALKTLEVTGLTGDYARWSNLLGGVILVAIGTLLIFRPQWLAFG